jgi:hypothetical protein
LLAVSLDEFWLEIKQVEVAGRACHEQLDDPFGARCVSPCRMHLVARNQFAPLEEHRGKRNSAQAAAQAPEKIASIGLLMSHDLPVQSSIRDRFAKSPSHCGGALPKQ